MASGTGYACAPIATLGKLEHMLILSVEAVLLFILLLAGFGLFVTKSISQSMRKFHTWWFKDSAHFLPIDPYKPLGDAFAEGTENFWPTSERTVNHNRPPRIVAVYVVVVSVVGIVFILGVFFFASSH
jgi:hypothetical protein